ncbi:MAG: hypothetical protein HPY85_16055 [Anaerolineae bacterium]|nr:hypothetical protein [Anaerolineae bacterium]
MKTNNKWLTLTMLAAAVLAVGLISFFAVEGTVHADEITPEDPEEVLPGECFPYNRRQAWRYGGEIFLQSIADQSGIALEDLQTAIEERQRLETVLSEAGFSDDEIKDMFRTAEIAVIDQGVADGKITEEQAEQMKTRLDEMIALREERQANRSALHGLWQSTLLEKLGLTLEEWQSILGETRDEVIEQALEQGLITEEQAQQWRENQFGEDGFGMGMPFGFGGERGGRGGRMPHGGMFGLPYDDTDS